MARGGLVLVILGLLCVGSGCERAMFGVPAVDPAAAEPDGELFGVWKAEMSEQERRKHGDFFLHIGSAGLTELSSEEDDNFRNARDATPDQRPVLKGRFMRAVTVEHKPDGELHVVQIAFLPCEIGGVRYLTIPEYTKFEEDAPVTSGVYYQIGKYEIRDDQLRVWLFAEADPVKQAVARGDLKGRFDAERFVLWETTTDDLRGFLRTADQKALFPGKPLVFRRLKTD